MIAAAAATAVEGAVAGAGASRRACRLFARARAAAWAASAARRAGGSDGRRQASSQARPSRPPQPLTTPPTRTPAQGSWAARAGQQVSARPRAAPSPLPSASSARAPPSSAPAGETPAASAPARVRVRPVQRAAFAPLAFGGGRTRQLGRTHDELFNTVLQRLPRARPPPPPPPPRAAQQQVQEEQERSRDREADPQGQSKSGSESGQGAQEQLREAPTLAHFKPPFLPALITRSAFKGKWTRALRSAEQRQRELARARASAEGSRAAAARELPLFAPSELDARSLQAAAEAGVAPRFGVPVRLLQSADARRELLAAQAAVLAADERGRQAGADALPRGSPYAHLFAPQPQPQPQQDGAAAAESSAEPAPPTLRIMTMAGKKRVAKSAVTRNLCRTRTVAAFQAVLSGRRVLAYDPPASAAAARARAQAPQEAQQAQPAAELSAAARAAAQRWAAEGHVLVVHLTLGCATAPMRALVEAARAAVENHARATALREAPRPRHKSAFKVEGKGSRQPQTQRFAARQGQGQGSDRHFEERSYQQRTQNHSRPSSRPSSAPQREPQSNVRDSWQSARARR